MCVLGTHPTIYLRELEPLPLPACPPSSRNAVQLQGSAHLPRLYEVLCNILATPACPPSVESRSTCTEVVHLFIPAFPHQETSEGSCTLRIQNELLHRKEGS